MSDLMVIDKITNYEVIAKDYLSSMGNKLPEKHLKQFIEISKVFGLNPFKREIYAVGYGENWNIITGYEVYLKRAERIGKLDGWNCTVEGKGDYMTATVTIYRKDWKMPFSHTVYFSEVVQKNKDGKMNAVWSKMPSFMCKKVAIAQGFRLCFPDEFGGMPYTADEMGCEIPLTEYKETKTENKIAPKTEESFSDECSPEQKAEIQKLLSIKDENGSAIISVEFAQKTRKESANVEETIAKLHEYIGEK